MGKGLRRCFVDESSFEVVWGYAGSAGVGAKVTEDDNVLAHFGADF